VPASPNRIRERGYDQAVLLAEVAGRRLGMDVIGALERVHATEAQHALGRAGRAENVGHVFALNPAAAAAVANRWVVLVDDVVTTGATLAGCATTLVEGGAATVSAVTVAREG
jgi:ComF family protein